MTSGFGRLQAQRGFTLIEVLMALTVFSLIAVLSYSALATTGDGFRALAEFRDGQQGRLWVDRQLRSDVAYISNSHYKPATMQQGSGIRPLSIVSDRRSTHDYDQLQLLVCEPGSSGIHEVRYYIDEEYMRLIRESRLLWAGDGAAAERWDMGAAESWTVEALDTAGNWQQNWRHATGARALRIRLKAGNGMHEWLLPIQLGVSL